MFYFLRSIINFSMAINTFLWFKQIKKCYLLHYAFNNHILNDIRGLDAKRVLFRAKHVKQKMFEEES